MTHPVVSYPVCQCTWEQGPCLSTRPCGSGRLRPHVDLRSEAVLGGQGVYPGGEALQLSWGPEQWFLARSCQKPDGGHDQPEVLQWLGGGRGGNFGGRPGPRRGALPPRG